MSTYRIEKVIGAVPSTIHPDCIYMVRVGEGFDLYVSDSTGSVAHKLNVASSTPAIAVDDLFSTDNLTGIVGNVLLNDNGAISVLFVNGSSVLVGEAVVGSDGGSFVISSDGSFTFDPDIMEPGITRISYTSTTGSANGTAILSVNVSESSLITESRLYCGENIAYFGDKQMFVKR